MKEKRNIKKETLFRLILREVKRTSKNIPEGREYSYAILDYYKYFNKDGLRLYEDAIVGDTCVRYTADELTSTDFCGVIKDAIRKSGLLADLRTETRWKENGCIKDGYEVFLSLKMLAPPCKSFKTLKRLLLNHTGDTLKDTAVYSADIRNHYQNMWSEEECRYLCHNESVCNEAKNWLVKSRKPKEKVSFGIVNSFEIYKKDEKSCSFKTQPDGKNKNGLEIKIVNPYGRKNVSRVFFV